ncbi:mechanosensitive ion channel family protein, partial [Hydrocoleum sp. CS-953]|uniref:mechanosensitive ion channel family protein n=1 Tax=Hydrocoleum sp. CS-953 TaxID=1671698 RepID=UPI00352A07C7
MVLGLGIFLLGNALAETIIASPKINPQSLDASLIRTVFRLLGLSAGTITLILGIERVGISIIPIIAGVGIGGLALALAARPTLENLIAGLILIADRPVKVGEYCRFGDEEGTILEIGLRSTRILSINGDLISIPNSQFSELKLANKSRRDRILLRHTIGLRYETTSDQLRFVLAKFREMILAHPKLLEEGARVRLIKYNDYSRDVEIFVYVDTGKLPEFLAIQEDVLLRVDDIVESSGTGFAFPSQTNY